MKDITKEILSGIGIFLIGFILTYLFIMLSTGGI